MKNQYLTIKVVESTFGASTTAKLTVNNNIVLWSEDTSEHNTNYIWDGWDKGFLKSLVGKHMVDVKKLCKEYFDWFYNQGIQSRDPQIIITNY